MTKIKIEKEIKDCQDCPCCGDEYGWGGTTTYYCLEKHNHNNYQLIAAQVEYRSEMPPVPKWCPHRVD